MIKWIALLLGIIAVGWGAEKDGVGREFDKVDARLRLLEHRDCKTVTVLTPSGQATICAMQP